MSLQNTPLQTVGAHQQRLMNLGTGSEIRCVRGALQVRFTETGSVFMLLPGQAVRVADEQIVAVESTGSSQFRLEQIHPVVFSQTQKNRQGLVALATRLWRSFATAA